MELKTRYQYTNFIYPYIIHKSKYHKYLEKLLKNKKCSIRFFEREKDLDIYTYYLPNVRKYVFPTFELSQDKKRTFKQMDTVMQATVLEKYPCTIFEYNLGEDIQGKAGRENGIFFNIKKMEIICFHTGICFLSIKTHIEDSENFEDVLNFNYTFRDIQSRFIALRQFENIKIQTNSFDDIQKFTDLIQELTGTNAGASELNLDTERFLTYSYTCIDQQEWNKNKEFEQIEHEFYKYCSILPSNYNISLDHKNKEQDIQVIAKWKYIRAGFSKMGSCLMTSAIDTFNYTKLPFLYENVYLYTYILALYKRIYLKQLNLEYRKSNNPSQVRKKFIDFTQELWIQDITNDDIGVLMYESWSRALELDKVFMELKEKYDILYKEQNIEKTAKTNKIIMIVLILSLLINILNFFVLLK